MSDNKAVIIDLRQVAEPGLVLARVCGLPALVRTLLVLQRRGYERGMMLVTPDQRPELEQAVERHPRVNLELAWIEDQGRSLDVALDVESLPDELERVLYWPAELTFGRLAPSMVDADPPAGGAVVAAWREQQPALALLSVDAVCEHPGLEPTELYQRLEQTDRLHRVELDLRPRWLREAGDPAQAEAALLRSLRKDADGVVAKYDRYISLAISRHLMKLPVHPDMVTFAAGVVGVACGLLAAMGTYWTLLAGALLFQANSIMDGIDGEIARAKLLESPRGQWLDTITDDTSNLLFTVGAAVGCARYYESEMYLVLAGVIGVGFLLTAVLEYHYLITVAHSGDLNQFKMPWDEGDDEEADDEVEPPSPGVMARVLQSLRFIVRRDTFVALTTLFAVLGQLRVMAWGFAVGSNIVWVSILVYRVILPLFRRRGPA